MSNLFHMPRAVRGLLVTLVLLLPQAAHAQTGNQVANPIVMVIVLGALALAPFIIVMLTSFVKISVVLSILRNALGTQQVPPNQIITGLAFVLTIFIMVPVARQMYDDGRKRREYERHILRSQRKSLIRRQQESKGATAPFLISAQPCERPGALHGSGGAVGVQRSRVTGNRRHSRCRRKLCHRAGGRP